MKNLLPALLIILFGTIIISSCTKTNLTNPAVTSQNVKSGKVTPYVYYCGTGSHWGSYLGKCVQDCPTGYHNDSITGACVINAGGPNRICGDDYYQFGLMGLTISDAVDSLGKWHNDFQIGMLSNMQSQNVNLNTDTLQNFLQNNTLQFAASKGITPQNTAIPNLDLSDSLWPNISSFSTSAQLILSNLESLVNNYTETNHASFISQCESLKSQALNLPNENEAVCVGFTVSVAINSFNYWKDNLTEWQNYLMYVPDTIMLSRQVPCNINLRHVGGADVSGAISGGAAGIEGGPALMFASGLVVGGTSSTFNILGQAATCLPGAAGRFSRWVASWF